MSHNKTYRILFLLTSVSAIIALLTGPASAQTDAWSKPFAPTAPEATAATLLSGDTGWYRDDGYHDPTNLNYAAGQEVIGEPVVYHDFFTFDLSGISQTVLTATLRAYNPATGYLSPDLSETWALYDVTTPITNVLDGTGGVGAYNDLGSGVSYGSVNVTQAMTATYAGVVLNTNGVTAINAGRGVSLTIGGALTTLGGTGNEYVFGNSGDFPGPYHQAEVVLTYSDLTTATLLSGDTGWYRDDGYHDPTNLNYAAGQEVIGGPLVAVYHDFFTFDLSGISQPVGTATLRVYNPATGYLSPDLSETWALYDVTTPITNVLDGTGGVGAYNDLGNGVSYGSVNVTQAMTATYVEVVLNTNGVTAINAGRGMSLTIGGALTTLGGTGNEYVFGNSGDFPGPYHQAELVLTYASDLRIQKAVTPTSVTPGQTLTYTLIYSNAGPGDAGGVVITDLVPSALTSVSYINTGATITRTGTAPYTWSVIPLTSGAGGIITITGVVSPNLQGVAAFTNTATITTTTVDSNTSNNDSLAGVTMRYGLTVNRAGSGSGTITSNPAGINCGATCSANFNYNTVVTLTAAANTGSTFTAWSGSGCAGTGTCSVTMSAARTVTGTFTLNTYIITPTAGAGGNIMPGTPQTVTYGGERGFTITPSTGYHILDVRVDGGSVGAMGVYTFTNVTANHTITAAFAINTYALTVNRAGNGSGTITSNPAGINCGATCSANFNYNTVVTLTAAANTGSTFSGWGSDCAGTGTCSVTMSAARAVTGTFTLNTYIITPTAGAGGSLAPGTPQTVNYGDERAFAITPNTGYHILDVGVDGGSVGAVGVYTFTNVTANHTITAAFALNTYTLTINTVGSGSVTKNPDQPTYHYGDVVTVTAVPEPFWAFAGWSGNLTGSDNPTSIVIDANKSITATFNATCLSITGADFNYTPLAPRVGQPVNFTAVITGGTAPITYTWNFGHGADVITTTGNVVHSFPLTTTVRSYPVTLTVANACSSHPAAPKSITVQPYGLYLPMIVR